MKRLIPLCLAAALALPALAEARQTDIALEEGHVEVQLSNGVFIGLTPGVDLTITHAEDGSPTGLEIRRGGAQVMTGFGDLDYFDVRIGGRLVSVLRGSAFLLASASGAVEATVLSGQGVSIEGVDLGAVGPGDHVTVAPDGAVTVARLSVEDLAPADDPFAAPPPLPAPPGAPAMEGVRDGAAGIGGEIDALLKDDRVRDFIKKNPAITDLFLRLPADDPLDLELLLKTDPVIRELFAQIRNDTDLAILNRLLLAAGGGGIDVKSTVKADDPSRFKTPREGFDASTLDDRTATPDTRAAPASE